MSHYMQHRNPTRMRRVETALQHMQDNPGVLDRDRHRFSESPPPYESPPITEPPSPSFWLAQRSASESDELFRRPFTIDELASLQNFNGYHPGHQYCKERDAEREHLRTAYFARDEEGRRTYSGPDLEGRSAEQRIRVMIRHSIRKRWERLGVWNPIWGIPGVANEQGDDVTGGWTWAWAKRRSSIIRPYTELTEWPLAKHEFPDERSMRQYIQKQGRWCEQGLLQLGNEIDVDPQELFITSRPWYQWQLEIEEEWKRLGRISRSDLLTPATANARARWQHDGRWKDTWGETPGWKWRDESPSPEPEDPNNMDFSPSEIDALNAPPPPLPPPPPSPKPKPFPVAASSLCTSDLFTPRFGPEPKPRERAGSVRDADEPEDADSDDEARGVFRYDISVPRASSRSLSSRESNVRDETRRSQRPDQLSKKRKRQQEGPQDEDEAMVIKSKRANSTKQAPSAKSDSDPGSSKKPSASESSNKMQAALGSLWLEFPPPEPQLVDSSVPTTNDPQRSGKTVKVRRSARLANRGAPGTGEINLHNPILNARRIANPKTNAPAQRKQPKRQSKLKASEDKSTVSSRRSGRGRQREPEPRPGRRPRR